MHHETTTSNKTKLIDKYKQEEVGHKSWKEREKGSYRAAKGVEFTIAPCTLSSFFYSLLAPVTTCTTN
jgi:hypothetical protein